MQPRIYGHLLQQALGDKRIVMLLGARQTGKTTLLRYFQQQHPELLSTFLSMEDPLIRETCNHHPYEVFSLIKHPRTAKQLLFIDEVQLLDNPSNFLKLLYDTYQDTLKIYVTGSSSFYLDKKYQDSLAGRKTIFTIRTLTFTEYCRFREKHLQEDDLLYEWEQYVRFGGFPGLVGIQDEQLKKQWLQDYLFSLVQKDVYETKIEHETKFFDLMKILASQTGALVNVHEIANTLHLASQTVEKYIRVLQKGFHCALISPFSTNIRSELTKMRKIYRYDLGLRNVLLNNFSLLEERQDKGAIVENIFFREKLFTHPLEGIQFRRTAAGQEVDFVVEREQAYEIKYQEDKRYKPIKSFVTKYPEIPLQMVSYADIRTQTMTHTYSLS